MLKLVDLGVDVKSFENTLNSFLKLFPNSYMPLLIMYLSKEGLLDVKRNIDEENTDVLLRVSKDELVEFMQNKSIDIIDGESMVDIYGRSYRPCVETKDHGGFVCYRFA